MARVPLVAYGPFRSDVCKIGLLDRGQHIQRTLEVAMALERQAVMFSDWNAAQIPVACKSALLQYLQKQSLEEEPNVSYLGG